MNIETLISLIIAAVNLVVLTITLGVLIWYTWETRRIANQAVATNLRPLMLRTGWILDWKVQSVEEARVNKPQFIEFTNLRNIAKDICGHVVINKRKYTLVFGNEISKETVEESGATVVKIGFVEKWGWLSVKDRVYGTYQQNKYEETAEENQIYLTYKDMEGNSYFTKEDSNFSQSSGSV